MKTPQFHAARRAGTVATLAGALGISALVSCAIASASSGHGSTPNVKVGVQQAPSMKLVTSPDEKVNSTGIQGALRSTGIEGTVDNPDQCTSMSTIAKVPCDIQSPEATPQDKAKAK